MDDGAVVINIGESVIYVVTHMMTIRSYIPGFSRRCTSCCQYSLFAEFQIFCGIFMLFSKFSLIFKRSKSEETLIGDFFHHHHV